MSDEKIDLKELDDLCALMRAPHVTSDEVLALVRAVRAAIVVAADPLSTDAVRRLDAALAPFTDSAEVS